MKDNHEKKMPEYLSKSKWLYKPKNRKLLEELKRRLKEEKATIYLGSFKKYIEE